MIGGARCTFTLSLGVPMENSRAETSRSGSGSNSKAYGIRNLESGTPEVRELQSDNYQAEMQKAGANVGFIVEGEGHGATLTKFLSRTADGIVKEQPFAK